LWSSNRAAGLRIRLTSKGDAQGVPASRRGLYEILLSEGLSARLRELEAALRASVDDLRPAEAGNRIALHLARVLERGLDDLPEAERVGVGIALARELVEVIAARAPIDTAGAPLEPGRVLRAILARRPDGSYEEVEQPLIPLLDTALLTNAPGEPHVGRQIGAEIASADRIDVVMAFIRWSGIAPLLPALRRHCEAGRGLRILTTTYTDSTEARALDALCAAGAQIRVSYDTSTTRLHAKAWLFHRESEFSTAYIGSSNLTHAAQVTGLEWNVRVSGARNPDVVGKMAAVFETYWNAGDFEPYVAEEFAARRGDRGQPGPALLLSPIELRAEPFQERLLEQLAVSRACGHHRNLLVAATGTGKTVMAALDYCRLRATLPRARLLFVAHREEILDQAHATFRHALRDPSFGESWVAGRRPRLFEQVFASIQSLAASGLGALDPRHFDVVIVDEFHHAAAPSYRALLDRVDPIELLGLTATPERSDGLPLLHWFDDRIAAELRLWDAIDQHRLCPFIYYGIHDGLDLRDVPWRRGHGYDVAGLTNLMTANDVWARGVIQQTHRRVADIQRMRALAFCVSVDHARFMARIFRASGITATAVWSDSPAEERRAALQALAEGRLQVLFSVDLFNEGVDVPSVDTLLLLRPTDSPTLFLQQLGRGLRRTPSKTVCTVLDFVGRHRTDYRFDRRFRALLGGSRRDLIRQVEQGFPFLPAGCQFSLDQVAAEIVLANLRDAIPSRWTAKVEELRAQATRGASVSLAGFLAESGLELEDVYDGGRSWSALREAVALPLRPAGPNEAVLRRACGRLLHVDDRVRLDAYRRVLRTDAIDPEALPSRERRLLRMLVAAVTEGAIERTTSLSEAWQLLRRHPQVCEELDEVFTLLDRRIDHLHEPLATRPDVPLQIHARYTRIEILAGFGVGQQARVAPWQSGCHWAEQASADLFAFTLDKTSGQFSPTTRYRDYAISRELIHWESQSRTRADDDTGARYIHHVERGTSIMLFARLRTDDRAFWFLGPATYVRHESEQPIAITWRLHHPLPGDLFTSFAAAVA
jgi:superfamily II DNA or RNA helicase/HKD family nuclease